MRYKPSSVPPPPWACPHGLARMGVPARAAARAKAIYLDPPSLTGSSRPGLRAGNAAYPRPFGLNRAVPFDELRAGRCLALRPVGFALPVASRRPRCALTAPFHPYPSTSSGRKPFDKLRAVCFLWHFPYPPSSRVHRDFGGRWVLPTTAVQRRSDFPPPSIPASRDSGSGLPRIRRIPIILRLPQTGQPGRGDSVHKRFGGA